MSTSCDRHDGTSAPSLFPFSTSRRLDRSERSYGPGGSSTRTSSGSLRASSSSSKIKEKKKKKEEEEKGKESPRSEEQVEDEEESEVTEEKDEEASVEKEPVTNGDAAGAGLRRAEPMEEEVKQEVRHQHTGRRGNTPHS